MPLRDFACSHCGQEAEQYYHHGLSAVVRCRRCGHPVEMQELSVGTSRKTGVFPFVSTSIDGMGTPVVVESLQHLRALERRYGVVATAFSQESEDSPRDLPEFRAGGRAYEGERPQQAYAERRREAVRRAIRNMELRRYAFPAVVR